MAMFSDKTGPLNMHIVAQIISSLFVLFLWTFARSTSAAIAFCVLFGMTSGAVIGLPPASMANILNATYNTPATKVIGHAKLGQWVGMMYSMAAIPSLVGPIVAGHLVTRYSDYLTVQMWCGTCLVLSAVCMLITRWYLPCADGAHVKVHIAHMLGKQKDEPMQEHKMIGMDTTTSAASQNQSQQQSDGESGAARRNVSGSDQNV
jgi:MCP family monocarboxylic acid transporter-like MFS transporter 10